MKLYQLFLLVLVASVILSCDEEENTDSGTMMVYFSHFGGLDHQSGEALELDLAESGSTDYDIHSMEEGIGMFNVATLQYYVTNIKLEGPNGEIFIDPMKVSAKAEEVTGYYLVKEGKSSSKAIMLSNVPAGEYDKITFTIGVPEEGIKEGAAGGVLDPAEGAPFWNWNNGYIGLTVEGMAMNSEQPQVIGDGWTIEEGSYAFHIGGWKDIEETTANNIKTLTFDLDGQLSVNAEQNPAIHMGFDIVQLLEETGVDFASTYAVHSPLLGANFAENLNKAFFLKHTHQTDSHEMKEDDHDHDDHSGEGHNH
ncbi:MbnP family protein [Reichenbachiella versicolor]|uniref:MbnP family protein n=1 Tax=Reichenbachiella versicolor TaxID=1821036 RepID=UPI000D6E0558|nr:MbnP family protein [Reichenbachiella versicolor]